MRRVKRILLYSVIFIVFFIVVAISYITFALPDVGRPENIQIVATPQRLVRGKYLVENVAMCLNCHSKRDWARFSARPRAGTLGGGGEIFDEKNGAGGSINIGTVVVPNITPYSLKNWSDGELFRAITSGVSKDGSAIFPIMPWGFYGKMGREDIYSIIVYIRTLRPIKLDYFKSKVAFPLNIVMHLVPKKATLGVIPKTTDSVKYGEYLAKAGACMECHSKINSMGNIPEGAAFAGGREFLVNGNISRSSNITLDIKTGIGSWTNKAFIERFKKFNDTTKQTFVSRNDFQTVMPWYEFSGLTEGDLKSIFAYLKTIKPVYNKVKVFEAAPDADNDKL